MQLVLLCDLLGNSRGHKKEKCFFLETFSFKREEELSGYVYWTCERAFNVCPMLVIFSSFLGKTARRLSSGGWRACVWATVTRD